MNGRGIVVAVVVVAAAVGGVVWLAGGAGPQGPVSDPGSDPTDNHGLTISPTRPWPKAVVVDGPMYEFETMSVGQTKTHTFIIKNEGEAPLQLKKGETTCKCTLSALAEDSIPPGEQAEIELSWTPKEPAESFRQEAEIFTNDPESKRIMLMIGGQVDELVAVVPSDTWNVGVVSVGNPRSVTGYVYSSTLEDFNILGIESPAEFLTAAWQTMNEAQLTETQAKTGYVVTLTAAADAPLGSHQETLTIKTDVPDLNELKVGVHVTATGPVEGLPYVPPGESASGLRWIKDLLAIDMGRFSQSEGRKGWYLLSVRGMADQEVEFREIEKKIGGLDPKDLHVEVQPDPRKSNPEIKRFIVTFHVLPGADKGPYLRKDAAKVVLHTNIPGAEAITFHVEFVVD